MTGPGQDVRRGRPRPGDPRLRVLLFLIVGALLLYATFNRGPSSEQASRRLNAAIKANMASYRPEPVVLTPEHAAAFASKLHPSVMIASTMAVPVSDLSSPGAVNCAVGYVVTNNSGLDIGDLLFGVTYSSGQATGSSVEDVSVPAFSTQGITPINALKGRCEGVTGKVTIHHCSFTNGADCSNLAQVIDQGAIALSRAR